MYKPKLSLLSFLMLALLAWSVYAYTPQYFDTDKNVKLKWKSKKISLSLSNSLFENNKNVKSKTDILATIKRSLKSWEDVADIEFELNFTDKDSISKKGTAGDGISLITIAPTSENLILFEDNFDNLSAITRLFYNSKGEIKEADIVLNPIQLFSNDGTFNSFDLEATLTHEIGHLLGLGHSDIVGSSMHSHQGKNGTYNQVGFNARTLSDDDIAGAISLYGKNINNINCCGKIVGKIEFENSRHIDEEIQIWLESKNSGRLIAGITTENGEFTLEGIPISAYNVFAKTSNHSTSIKLIASVDLTLNKITTIEKTVKFESNNVYPKYVGANGQLAKIAVPIRPGKIHTIYIAGKNIEPEDFEVKFHSKYFTVIKDSLLEHNYGLNISVYSFDVFVEEDILIGDYNFYLTSKIGKFENFVGGVSVENIEY